MALSTGRLADQLLRHNDNDVDINNGVDNSNKVLMAQMNRVMWLCAILILNLSVAPKLWRPEKAGKEAPGRQQGVVIDFDVGLIAFRIT